MSSDMEERCRHLEARNSELQHDLGEAKSEVAVASCVRESLVELERRKGGLESEVTTLQHLLQESHQESDSSRTRYEHEIARIRAVVDQLEAENAKLSTATAPSSAIVVPSLPEDKDAALNAISDVTKSLARKVKSNFHSAIQAGAPPSAAEEEMKKAHEDTELLRAIVVPLEEQIVALKEKLRATDFLLTESELSRSESLLGSEAMARWLEGTSGGPESALRALSELPDPEQEPTSLHLTLLAARTAVLASCLASSESEAASLKEQLSNAREALSDAGSELAASRSALAERSGRLEALVKNEERLRLELSKDAEFRKAVEGEWSSRAEEHRAQRERLSEEALRLRATVDRLESEFAGVYAATRSDLRQLGGDRERLVRELKRLQDENDTLVGKHAAKAEEMQEEVIDLPERMEDIHMAMLRLREELITAKLAKERLEERHASEASFLRAQLAGEQQAREGAEDEAERARERLAEAEAGARAGADARRADEMAGRIKTLQLELDNSVAVQNDFVRLSQSLQVELEKIRQCEKEVRWQHEDDMKDCQGCKVNFASAPRRKHHCRHCGRVYCADCLTKSVPSGPQQRPARVCDVCHTLLVQNSAPYFATEAPKVEP